MGALTFPLVAFVALVPYMIYEYRRYGSIPAWKSFVVFSLILYAICAYYMVILPLPESRTAVVAYAAHPQLVPFEFVGEFRQAAAAADLSLTDPMSWFRFVAKSSVYTELFNVLLTFPIGFFVHYLFGGKWWHSVIAGFCTSLFFELTQLSGLYGIYEHPYRLFDVDDLIINTTGAFLGYVCTLPVCRALPQIDDVNARALERGRSYPSVTRRALALLIDLAMAYVLTYLIRNVLFGLGATLGSTERLATTTAAVSLLLVLLPPLAHGGTLGERILRMRVVMADGTNAPWWRILGRKALVWWALFLLPAWVIQLFPGYSFHGVPLWGVRMVVWGVWFTWAISLIARVVAAKVGKHSLVMLNAWATGTRIMSEPEIEAVLAAADAAAGTGMGAEPAIADGEAVSELTPGTDEPNVPAVSAADPDEDEF